MINRIRKLSSIIIAIFMLVECGSQPEKLKPDDSKIMAEQSRENINALSSIEIEHQSSVFNNVRAEPLRKLSVEDFIKPWYALPVTRGTGMFNPMFLSFQYTYEGGKEDLKQSLTFPCLLSFKFDFVPDNFNNFHPAFVFRRYPDVIKIKQDQKESISSYIKTWSATHAIGGELIQGKDGYRGTLVVFDSQGKEIIRQKYQEVMPYFELMGKLVQTWMNYRNQKISPGLLKELERPMCRDMETVRWYGESFDVEWHAQAEWDIYDKILKRDPSFGEVQFWYANQKGWETGDSKAAQIGKGKSLVDHLIMPALNEFSPSDCTDQKLVENFYNMLNYAESIIPENPEIIYKRLNISGKDYSIGELDALIPVTQEYTRSYYLIDNLAFQFKNRGYHEKSIPLYLSALNSGFKTGTGRYDYPLEALSRAFWDLGLLAESIAYSRYGLKNPSKSQKPWLSWDLGLSLRESFNFNEAAICFRERFLAHQDIYSMLIGYMCLYEGGLMDKVLEWEKDPVMGNIKEEIAPFIESRKLLEKGAYEQAIERLKGYPFDIFSGDEWLQREAEIIRADILILSDQINKAKKHAINAWYMAPRSRRTAYLLEQTLGDDIQSLGRFARIAFFIFKEQEYWQRLFGRIKEKGYEEEGPENIISEYNKFINELNKSFARSKIEFFIKQPPFLVEHVALSMIQMEDEDYRQRGLSLYRRYSELMQELSFFQKVHSRIFLRQLMLVEGVLNE